MSSYIVSCDEAVYQICEEILWKTKNEFDDMVFRLGSFHSAKNFLGVIGKRMDGSGSFFSGHHPHCLSIVE